MDIALSIWIMLYSHPTKAEFYIVNAVPAITHEVKINSIDPNVINQTKGVTTPSPTTDAIYDNAPQGVIMQPSGCPYGDAIPLDKCDIEKYQNQIH